jgi:hypothetical protein
VAAFLESRGGWADRKIPEQIWLAAEKAQGYIERELQEGRKRHVQASQLRKSALQQAAKIGRQKDEQRIITGLPQEQAVRALLAGGDTAAAGEQLLQLIERTARAGNFHQAEQLRDWLAKIDASNLSRLITAAEVVAREKGVAVDHGHLEIWHETLRCPEQRGVRYPLPWSAAPSVSARGGHRQPGGVAEHPVFYQFRAGQGLCQREKGGYPPEDHGGRRDLRRRRLF